MQTPSAPAADDVERVVRTQIHARDPVHHGQADDDDASGAAEIEEQEHRDRARDDRVSRHERLAAYRDVAAEVSASQVAVTDARSRPLPVDDLLDDLLLEEELQRDHEDETQGEPPLAVQRGNDRDDDRHEEDAEQLEHVHDGSRNPGRSLIAWKTSASRRDTLPEWTIASRSPRTASDGEGDRDRAPAVGRGTAVDPSSDRCGSRTLSSEELMRNVPPYSGT